MGLINSTIRLTMLVAMRQDLEYKIQLVTQSQMNLAQSVSDLMEAGVNLDSDSPRLKLLQQRQAKLQVLEKRLVQQMNQYKARLDMVNTEIESCSAMRDKNIQIAFKY